jgi:hypothetical protein
MSRVVVTNHHAPAEDRRAAVVTLGIWAVATILGITLPVMETGTDPTQIPFAAIFAPVAAATLTALAGAVARKGTIDMKAGQSS